MNGVNPKRSQISSIVKDDFNALSWRAAGKSPANISSQNWQLEIGNGNLKISSSLAWFDRCLGVGAPRLHWRSRAHHHVGSVATDQWLVRFVLGFVGMPVNRMAVKKIRRYQISGVGTFSRRRSDYHGWTADFKNRGSRTVSS